VSSGPAAPWIIRIDDRTGLAEPQALDAARLAPGSPMPAQTVRNLYSDGTGQFHSGIWSSTPGAWRVAYTENELCVLTQGRIRISDDHGRTWSFSAGDCFVVPSGFAGLWEVLEEARKFYAIFEPPAAGG
jgi:uncharacterized protein